jgi:purine-nucleoside phosphorylase
VSVGTGGGIVKNVENADINLTLSCIRLDKVVEVLFCAEVPVGADNHLGRELRVEIEKTVADLDVGVDSAIHATVPSFLAETKELLINLQKQGALSVDMGLSVLYILADHHRKKMAGTVRIGDLPLKGLPTWKSRSYKLQLKKEVHKRITQASSIIFSSPKTATCHLLSMVDPFPARRSLLFQSLSVRINSVS